MTTPKLGFFHRFERSAKNDSMTLLGLHGTGGDENDLFEIAKAIRPAANILCPRGKVLEGNANRFFRRTALGAFDLEDLRLRTKELKKFVSNAAKEYSFSEDALVGVGYSNGANMLVNLLLHYPDSISGVILLRPLLPSKPVNIPDLSGKKVLVLAGKKDALIFPAKTTELLAYLEKTRCQVQCEWLELGHDVSLADVDLARVWIAGGFPEKTRQEICL
ncbi:MAG: alpha/beta hydrolase [Candidatus Diapherotrites archaeon]|uniref:Alpha/beta hydrolase n=1 Tax=Candidatus Iainarchaeum sp. TaxID=3101447 RepID=A0A8T4L5Q0_9ARCH|nr:alpha/beta hydrolase [Candidatus Diapherotrites archaeon]